MKTKKQLEESHGVTISFEALDEMEPQHISGIAKDLGLKYANVKRADVVANIRKALHLEADANYVAPVETEKAPAKKETGKDVSKMEMQELTKVAKEAGIWKVGDGIVALRAKIKKHLAGNAAPEDKKEAPPVAPKEKKAKKAAPKKNYTEPLLVKQEDGSMLKLGRQPNGILDEAFYKTLELNKKEEEILKSKEVDDSEKMRMLLDINSKLTKNQIAKVLMRSYSMVFITLKNYITNVRKSRPFTGTVPQPKKVVVKAAAPENKEVRKTAAKPAKKVTKPAKK